MKATLLSIGAIAALLMAGCSQEAKSDMAAAGDSAANAASKTGDAAAADTKAAGAAVQDAGAKTVEATKDAGAAVAQGAQKAGAAVAATGTAAAKAVGNAAENAGEATMTPKVKTALLNAAGLESKDINVETANKTITLKGSVPDAKQKTQAETVTKGIAGSEFKVVNQLTVAGK